MGQDALIQLAGKNVLVGGDPDYQDLVIGSPNPENQLLDPQTNKAVSQLVLEIFGIPFNANTVLGGALPGIDIKNQDPITMLKLSLASELLDTPPPGSTRTGGPGFAEVEIDEQGVARFYIAGRELASSLDIRYCIPTSQITQPVDLVIIRGYDPPPRRELRTSFDGLKNKEIMNYGDCAQESCDESIVNQYATISYDDPQLDQAYLDDIVNSYELQAFETLLGYLVDLDLPDGTDPNSSNFVPGLKITFGDTTKEYIKISANLLNATTLPGTITDSDGIITIEAAGSVTSTSATAGTNSSVTALVTTVQPRGDECTVAETPLAGSAITIRAERFRRLNKFGIEESDFIGVVDVVFSGRKVQALTTGPGAPSLGFPGVVRVTVRANKELISLQQGKNWTYEVDQTSNPPGDVTIHLFSVIEDAFTAFVCNTYRNPISATGNPNTSLFLFNTTNALVAEAVGVGSLDGLICNIGDALGYKVVNGEICLVVERKRPSIDIFDPLGNALAIANQISIEYTPIVIVDKPAPIAYAATGILTSIDGTRTLPVEGIIDQADGIVDSDPTTDQDLEDSELSILQDNTNGSTIDVTLPFAFGVANDGTEGTECLEIARNLLALQNNQITTHSVVLGPDSIPRLGDAFTLPNGEIGILNEINYSYSDSSQYLITATVGPEYLTSGSFNDSKYQLRTEDVTREGFVIQDAGNGAEYTVRIEGLGEFPALLMVLEDVSVGDKVGCRIYNNPVEKI
jgi:hypothetical protein